MEILGWLIFVVMLFQSLETGSFLTLDIATKSLQRYWGYNNDQMVAVGTIGYSLGFALVGTYGIFINRIRPQISILVGGIITAACWLSIYLTLCQNCIPWVISMLFEAGIGSGTAVSYLTVVKLISKSTYGNERKTKLIILALFVAIGSILSFVLFVDLNNVPMVILIMFGFTCGTTLLLFIISFFIKEEEMINLPGDKPVEKNFSAAFGMYLFSLNLTFGVIMTFINSANPILETFEKKVSLTNDRSQFPLICFAIGNLIGRGTGIFLKNYLKYLLHVFIGFSFLIGIFNSSLLIDWKIELIYGMLGLTSIFFGIVWATSSPLAREFFGIAEERGLSLVFFGMAIGPVIFGSLAAKLYKYRTTLHNKCDSSCFWAYLCISNFAIFLSAIGYGASWYLRRNERLRGPDIL